MDYGKEAVVKPVAILVLAALASQSAAANPYDDCVLEHVGSAPAAEAVWAIERACISKTSQNLPAAVVALHNTNKDSIWAGTFNYGTWMPERGLLFNFENDTGYIVTELQLIVTDQKTAVPHIYTVRHFPSVLPAGMLKVGGGEPGGDSMLAAGTKARFFVPVDEVMAGTPVNEFQAATDKFAESYYFSLIPTRGIPP